MNRLTRIIIPLVALLVVLIAACGCFKRPASSYSPDEIRTIVERTDWSPGEISRETTLAYETIRAYCSNPEGVDVVVELLNSDDADLRVNTANLLWRLRDDDVVDDSLVTAIVPALLDAMEEGNVMTHENAIIALMNATSRVLNADFEGILETSLDQSTIHSLSLYCVTALTIALTDDRGRIQELAAHALAPFGSQAEAAVPELRLLLTHDDPVTRLEAAIALGNITPHDAGDVVPVLVEGISHTEGIYLRKRAIRALGYIGADAIDALPVLEEMRQDPSDDIRAEAEAAIRMITAAIEEE